MNAKATSQEQRPLPVGLPTQAHPPSSIVFASAHPDTQTKIRPRPTSTSTPTPTRKNPPLTECLDETQTRVCVGGYASEGEGWGSV